jgi:menaquinone-dependent protoporphyrinogen oxidase
MTTAIVHASKHGATAEIARRIANKIGGETRLFDLDDGAPDLSEFTTVILGTAVYAGQPMKAMREFTRTASLAGKRLGLYASGMESDLAKRDEELADAFPDELHAQAVVEAFLPGRFQFSKMSLAERFIIKRIAKTNRDVDGTDEDAITAFAAKLV